MIDLRLAAPAAVTWVGLVVVLPAPGLVGRAALIAGAAAAASLAVAAALRRRRLAGPVTAALALVAVCGAASATAFTAACLHLPLREPHVLGHPVAAVVHGTMSSQQSGGGGSLRMTADEVEVRGRVTRVDLPVLVTGLSTSPGQQSPRVGDRLVVAGTPGTR